MVSTLFLMEYGSAITAQLGAISIHAAFKKFIGFLFCECNFFKVGDNASHIVLDLYVRIMFLYHIITSGGIGL